MLFTLSLSLTEDGNVDPNLDGPESNLGCLQALQFSIGQILVKLLRGEKREEDWRWGGGGPWGWERAFPDWLWPVSICSSSIHWHPPRLPLVPTTAHLSSRRLRSISEPAEGPHVIRRGQPGEGGGARGLVSLDGTSKTQLPGPPLGCLSP